jgi:hypothetical protein
MRPGSHWLVRALLRHAPAPLTRTTVEPKKWRCNWTGRAPRVSVATARIHRLTLLTTDTKLRGYRHATVKYFTPILGALEP